MKKKAYICPAVSDMDMVEVVTLLAQSLTGDTGTGTIGTGNDDEGGEGSPDSKTRGGFEDYGSLW